MNLMDLFEYSADNVHEFTVSEISGAVKRTIEGEFGHVRVKGEVGRVVIARTGHMYFDLKDDRSVLAAVSWKGQVSRLTHRPEEGMEVIVTGRMTTFGPQSKYQLNVEDVRPAGAGALMAMLEKRKAALQAEGLFAPERKQNLPYLPDIIGVVTSPTGAVIRDILHRLRDRFPRKVLVWPVAVQGKECAAQVANAINGFNRLTPGGALPRPDVIIVARGGGSVEDLWGFNEELVVRAAAQSAIPLISAVGHETDTTLIDYAADVRAPTPTAAAELAVPVRAELLHDIAGHGRRLLQAVTRHTEHRRQRLEGLARLLPGPERLLDRPVQEFDLLSGRLDGALHQAVHTHRLRLLQVSAQLRPTVPRRFVRDNRQRLEHACDRMNTAMQRILRDRFDALARHKPDLRPVHQTIKTRRDSLHHTLKHIGYIANHHLSNTRTRLESLDRLRLTLGYEATLDRGFAVVRQNGQVVTLAKHVDQNAPVEILFADGSVQKD